eukprot:1684286-Rhodomonas_salina.2
MRRVARYAALSTAKRLARNKKHKNIFPSRRETRRRRLAWRGLTPGPVVGGAKSKPFPREERKNG